jgi:hypothetical protein
MAIFAEITDGIVTNIIVADNIEFLNSISNKLFVEYTDDNPAGIGWTYNGSTFHQPTSSE